MCDKTELLHGLTYLELYGVFVQMKFVLVSRLLLMRGVVGLKAIPEFPILCNLLHD